MDNNFRRANAMYGTPRSFQQPQWNFRNFQKPQQMQNYNVPYAQYYNNPQPRPSDAMEVDCIDYDYYPTYAYPENYGQNYEYCKGTSPRPQRLPKYFSNLSEY